MSEEIKMELPEDLGAVIDMQIKSANPELEVGWMLIAVAHGKPIQTMTNVEESTQLMMTQIAHAAIAAEAMNVSSLLNPEGSA